MIPQVLGCGLALPEASEQLHSVLLPTLLLSVYSVGEGVCGPRDTEVRRPLKSCPPSTPCLGGGRRQIRKENNKAVSAPRKGSKEA